MRIKSAARKEQDDAEKREGDREGESDCKGGRCSKREKVREGARHQLEASGDSTRGALPSVLVSYQSKQRE